MMVAIELQEDLVLKNFHKCHSTVKFLQQVTERKYPELKKTSSGARPAEAPPENYTWAPLSANKVNRKNYTKCDCVQFCVYVP